MPLIDKHDEWGLLLYPDSVRLSANGWSHTLKSAQTPTVGSWSHILGTWDGSQAKIYLNCSVIAESSISGSIYDSSYPLYAASDQTAGVYHFNGAVDDVRFFDGSLTEAEVQTLCEYGSFNPKPDLVPGEITVSPASPTTSEQVQIQGVIENIGPATTGTTYHWRISVDGVMKANGQVAAPGSGQETSVTTNPFTYTEGSHTILFEVDTNTEIDESDETNEETTHEFTVTDPGQQDLVAGALTVTSASPTTSDQVTIQG